MLEIAMVLLGSVAGFATFAMVSVAKDVKDVDKMKIELEALEQACNELAKSIDILIKSDEKEIDNE